MNTREVWQKLSKSKKYREEFVGALLKRSFPLQVRALRKKRMMSQPELAKCAGITQGVVSRAEDPDYGNLTFNTVIRIAAGFDLAFIGKFVSFSEFGRWAEELSQPMPDIPSFNEEAMPVRASGKAIRESLPALGRVPIATPGEQTIERKGAQSLSEVVVSQNNNVIVMPLRRPSTERASALSIAR